jgi:hypothetical protein
MTTPEPLSDEDLAAIAWGATPRVRRLLDEHARYKATVKEMASQAFHRESRITDLKMQIGELNARVTLEVQTREDWRKALSPDASTTETKR